MGVWLQTEIRAVAGVTTETVRDWLRGDGGQALTRAGGGIWGFWDGRGGLGFRSDTLLLSTHWPDDAAAGAAVELLKASTLVVDVRGTPLHPTLRPADATPCAGDGAWVFREFVVDPEQTARFVELSQAAWPSFEDRHDAHIHGLFRGPATRDEQATFLLVTRYADLATWEASRSESADPEAWARFRERHALTRWTRGRSAVRIEL
ncbi:MAG TPA: hypothetical protein VLA56_09645 [Pseudomonadales bacterium]|nr:hypothetical protein [Pseudomonadales bacterium]